MELFYLCNFGLMCRLLLLVLVCIPLGLKAQMVNDSDAVNPRYFEDQFYLSISYNFLLNLTEGVKQQNLSYGLEGGFIKDIPFNYDRTIGMGIGLGLGLNTYYTNMRATRQEAGVQYTIIDENEPYKRNKLETHSVEFPLEFRWRNSTATEFKFWRIYTGIKFAYTYDARSKFVPDDDSNIGIDSFSNPDVRKFHYGLTFNFGFNSFNAHVYYSLTNLLNDNVFLGEESIQMKPLRVGLIFYIL